ncbi:MAG: hypothetical protein KDB82_11600 [Planctomycetes bacterium]|nr:hypothetical protein [Planctomycetota bacterium]
MRYCLFLLLLLAGCAGAEFEGDQGPPLKASDMLSMHRQAPFSEQLHDAPKVGQYWLTVTSNPGGLQQKEGKCVARRVEDCVIVEHQYTWRGVERPGDEFQWAVAYLVRPSDPKHRVLRGWRAVKGDLPREMPVMTEPPNPVDHGGEYINSERPFTRRINEQEFHGTRTDSLEIGQPTMGITLWVADNGWFDRVVETHIQLEDGHTGTKVTEARTDGESWIDWEGVDTRPDYMLDQNGFVVPRK